MKLDTEYLEETSVDLKFYATLSPEQQRAFRNKFPSVFWVPNIAQARPWEAWRKPPYPRTHVITFGNRSGKTEETAEFLTGCAKGNKFVNQKHCYSQFFDDLDDKRLDGTLTIWWVCIAEMMKKDAPNYKIIKKHIPDAEFKRPNNTGVFREIHIPIKGRGGKPYYLVVHIKTHDQDTLAFAGDNVDVIICDEPPPQKHWGEIAARMVTLVGEAGGRIIIGGTPLKIGGFLLDVIEDEQTDDLVIHDEGSIWENCHGSELPEEMAKKYNIPFNPTTQMYDTRGHLSVEGIRSTIAKWSKSGDPDELIARVDGKFTHIQGRIYKKFRRGPHTIDPFDIPKSYPIVMVCDPHDNRPDCAGWYVTLPSNKFICIMEYPVRPYELLTSRSRTIPQTCAIWQRMEAEMGIRGQVVRRIGDPNRMLSPDAYNKMTKQQQYKKHGFKFSVNVNDDIAFGHEKVRQFLYYDEVKFELYPEEPMYHPQLMFFNTCRNHIVFMTKYSTKVHKDMEKAVSEIAEEKWKDFADLVRYGVVTFREFVKMAERMRSTSDYDAIRRARDPNSFSIGNTYGGKISSNNHGVRARMN